MPKALAKSSSMSPMRCQRRPDCVRRQAARPRWYFLPADVVTGVTNEMLVAREETFVRLRRCSVLRRSRGHQDGNDTEFGLASYFYTRDLARSGEWRKRSSTASWDSTPA